MPQARWGCCFIPRLLLVLAMGSAGLTVLAGCQDPLFPRNAPRSPYQRYQLLRGQAAPQYEHDARGARRPALRERLQPLGRR